MSVIGRMFSNQRINSAEKPPQGVRRGRIGGAAPPDEINEEKWKEQIVKLCQRADVEGLAEAFESCCGERALFIAESCCADPRLRDRGVAMLRALPEQWMTLSDSDLLRLDDVITSVGAQDVRILFECIPQFRAVTGKTGTPAYAELVQAPQAQLCATDIAHVDLRELLLEEGPELCFVLVSVLSTVARVSLPAHILSWCRACDTSVVSPATMLAGVLSFRLALSCESFDDDGCLTECVLRNDEEVAEADLRAIMICGCPNGTAVPCGLVDLSAAELYSGVALENTTLPCPPSIAFAVGLWAFQNVPHACQFSTAVSPRLAEVFALAPLFYEAMREALPLEPSPLLLDAIAYLSENRFAEILWWNVRKATCAKMLVLLMHSEDVTEFVTSLASDCGKQLSLLFYGDRNEGVALGSFPLWFARYVVDPLPRR